MSKLLEYYEYLHANPELSRQEFQTAEFLMQTLTDTRAKGNQYMCLRIQSIYRQVLVDLLAYADACVQRGEPFHADMEHLENITGNALRALR